MNSRCFCENFLFKKSDHQPFMEYLKSNPSNNSSESGSAGSPEPYRQRSVSMPGEDRSTAGNRLSVGGNPQLNGSNQNLGPQNLKRRSPRPGHARKRGLSGFAAAAKHMQSQSRPSKQYRLFKVL